MITLPDVAQPAEARPRRPRGPIILGLVVAAAIAAAGVSFAGSSETTPPRVTARPDAETYRSPLSGAPRAGAVDLASPDQPSRGSRDAPVVIVEFTDYGCAFCARHHNTVFEPLLSANAGKVRYVVRNYPVDEVHAVASAAAEAAECAHAQGRFWDYHDALFADQEHLARSDLLARARSLRLDISRFDECLSDPKTTAAVQKDVAAAESVGVRGTPTFLINGHLIAGAKPLQELQAQIDEALAADR